MSFERVDLQLRREQGAQDRSIDLPVREEQVVPALRHHPRPRRHRPGPVRTFFQDRIHSRFQDLLDKLIV
ncbi:MAG: hypothetical protein AUI12_08155 [Acidobacteria bacterium 13_2_20CM_2_57_6]|nr:MAG: hypothetical protein AUI12_08155 [Acidobacteria bacterium 13_2_20CM_2_57_6]